MRMEGLAGLRVPPSWGSEMDLKRVQWGGLRGIQGEREGRSPHPSLEIGPRWEPGFLAGVVDQLWILCTYV